MRCVVVFLLCCALLGNHMYYMTEHQILYTFHLTYNIFDYVLLSQQSLPDVMRWRNVSCVYHMHHGPLTTSTSSWQTSVSLCLKCLPCPICPLLSLKSPNSCRHSLLNWHSYRNKFPSNSPKSPHNSQTRRFLVFLIFPAFPCSYPASHNSCPTFRNKFQTSRKWYPTFHKGWLAFHGFQSFRNRSPAFRNNSPAYPKKYPTFHRRYPAFPSVPSSATLTFKAISTNLSRIRMPKEQPQKSRDLELDRLVRQSPLHSPRTPSPSSPSSVLDLPNVPSHPRLPPITPSRQLSGVSNPAFHIEDGPTSARPSGDQRCLLFC